MLSDLALLQSYDSGEEGADIVSGFIEPVLTNSGQYLRLAGYFNSGMLAAAARGMANFIANGGTMKIVASPNLSKSDLYVLENVDDRDERLRIFSSCLERDIADLDKLENLLVKRHVEAMAWMLKEKRLEIRIAVPASGSSMDALFHHKVGIAVSRDGGERLSFSGSINETAAAWTKNFEDFKVFREWVPYERTFFNTDLKRFNDYWDGTRTSVEVISLPQALESKLLEYAPSDFDALKLRSEQTKPEQEDEPLEFHLRDYQARAVDKWEEHGFQGILAMATGTGKTKTAIACVRRLLNFENRLFIIAVSPYQHIATQWTRELKQFSPVQLAGSANWKKSLQMAVDSVLMGTKQVASVSVVQETAANDSFLSIIEKLTTQGVPVLFIGDEAHGLGAQSRRSGLSQNYKYRLGLSATPARYFDEDGTTFLEEYFKGDAFTFSIDEALEWRDPINGKRALCDYTYHPVFVTLTPDEEEKYRELSEKISKASAGNNGADSPNTNDRVKRLLMDRARVLKGAKNKIRALDELIQKVGKQKNAIVYCAETKQLISAGQVLSNHGESWHRFTGDEGTTGSPSEREEILMNFASGNFDALVAMKCLDEGVDVPSAKIGMILASSGNPREFVQRRGRLLRPDSSGRDAVIYDFVVKRSPGVESNPVKGAETYKQEVQRMLEFARSAKNELEVRALILENQ